MKPRVVMAGPLPPAIGGMATVIGDIAASSLAQHVELVLFDSGKRTPAGRSLVQAVRTRLQLWRDWWRALAPAGRTVAHIHTCSGLTFFLDGVYAALARWRGVPVVLHVHGARFDDFLDGLSGPKRALARRIARRADRVVVLSEEWRDKLAQRLPGARLEIVANGVAEPVRVDVERQDNRLTVLFLGNLCRRKGVWDLLASVAHLPDDVRVVLVGGEEDPGIGAALNQRIAAEGLGERIEWVGPAVGEAKLRWLSAADLFVLPSYAEGVPISMLEALAAGLPAVLTPVGGIPSVLTADVHALFVPPGDPVALADAIARLAASPELRATLGAAAREHVLARYGVEHSARRYLDLYARLLPAEAA